MLFIVTHIAHNSMRSLKFGKTRSFTFLWSIGIDQPHPVKFIVSFQSGSFYNSIDDLQLDD
jgi:hypothetical protein